MQPFPASMTPLRTANPAPYGLAAPSGPVECKKAPAMMPAARMPIAGRIAHAAPAAVPAAVAAAPTPSNAKIQPQLQNLPRFQPPSFEGLNGTLPCPDSPGSTPREGAQQQLQQHVQHQAGPLPPPQPVLPQTSVAPSLQQQRDDELPPPVPTKVRRSLNSAESTCSLAEKPTPLPAVYATGSYVEYRSRSSGQWILAKVESYDELNQCYRLDVQPHAQPDRVRPRGSGTPPSAEPPFLQQVVEPQRQPSQMPPEAEPMPRQDMLPQTLHLDANSPPCIEAPVDMYGRSGEVDTSRLLMEMEAMRMQLLRLQSENDTLQERLKQEAALKDQYLSELCSCHEQLQRFRGLHQGPH